MATLAAQAIITAGITPTYSAAAAGTKLVCGDRAFLHVKNASASPVTVTITGTGSVGGQLATDLIVTVPATSGDKMIGPINASAFAGATDGLASVTYSATTTVTVAALRI